MAKQTSSFYCTNCDYRPPKWLGCCPGCQEWDSIAQKTISKTSTTSTPYSPVHAQSLNEISVEYKERIRSGIDEWDRVMGGGIVPGSFILITGDPGIGKSTLLLQIAHLLAEHQSVLYCSSEESLQQIKGRAQRLNCQHSKLLFSDQTSIESILDLCTHYMPTLLIVDSIQHCLNNQTNTIPGTAAQLREAAFALMRLAKEKHIAILATGHITKEGIVAGPKMLEHMVDGVFYLQGEEEWNTRILRAVKNRFGSINELGFFQMEQTGLQPVPNINQRLLNERSHAPGAALISCLEGSRPLLLELQALTVPTKFGIAQRIISGIDHKQVTLIAAILEKYLRIPFSTHDIFFKVSGGFKIKESSADLGIALALLSSYLQKPLPFNTLALAEINLTGLIKPIANSSYHLLEASSFGLLNCFIASNQSIDTRFTHLVKRFSSVYELISLFPE